MLPNHQYQLGFRWGVTVCGHVNAAFLQAGHAEEHFDRLVDNVLDLDTYDIAIWKLTPKGYGDLVGFATRQDGVERYQPARIDPETVR